MIDLPGLSPSDSKIPWRSSTVVVILSSSLIGVMGVSLISPVLPELRPVFDVSDAEIGLLITVFTLPGIVITPFIGLVADRLGRRRVLVPLLFVFGLSGAAIAGITDFRLVLLLRFVQGIGATALVTLAVTLIGDFYEGERRAALVGLNGSLLAIGAAFYPLIGGALASVRWNVPFLFFGVSVLIGLLAFVALEEPPSDPPSAVGEYLRRIGAAARLPQAVAIFAGLLAVFAVFFGAVFTAVPLLLSDEFGLAAGPIGVVVSMVSIGSAITASQYWRLADRRPAAVLVAIGFLVCGASLALIWFAVTAVMVAPALFGFGLGIGLIMPAIDTTILASVSAELRAGMMGLRTSMIRLGQTLGPIAITFTADSFFATTVHGYRVLILVGGSLLIVTGVGALVVVRR